MTHGSSGLDLSLVLRLLLYPLSSSIVARVFLFFLFFLLSSFCLLSVFFLLSIVLIVVLIAFDFFFLSQLECTHVPPHS